MPIRVSTSGSYGESGVADVAVTPKKIRVVFEENDMVVDILPEDAPSYLISGRQIVTLSSDNTQILSARPVGGSHFIRFDKFTARENEPPTPKVREASKVALKDGRKWDVPAGLDFTSIFKIVRGKWKGYELIYKVPYAFVEFEGTGETQIVGYGSKRCADLLQLCGVNFESDTIPFSENILPFLEKLFRQRNRLLTAKVEDGWIKHIYEAPDDDSDDEESPAPRSTQKIVNELYVEDVDTSKTTAAAKTEKSMPTPEVLKALKVLAMSGDPGAKQQLDDLGIEY